MQKKKNIKVKKHIFQLNVSTSCPSAKKKEKK